MFRNRALKEALKWVLKCLITIGILYYLFLKIPINQVATALINIKAVYLLPALFLQLSMRYINAYQMKIFVKQQKMNFTVFELMKINLVTLFYGLILPGELSSSLIKWYKLSKDNKMRAQAVACIVLSRTMNILCLAVLGIVFFLIERPYNSISIGVFLIFGLLISILLYLFITNAPVSSKIENLVNGLPISKIPFIVREKIDKVWRSIKRFNQFSSATLNHILFLSFLYHLVGIFSACFIMKAVGIDVPLISIIWIRAAAIFVQMFPISVSGLGIREGVFVFLLSNYDVSGSEAMAFSFIIFGIIVAMSLMGGILEAQEIFLKKVSIGDR